MPEEKGTRERERFHRVLREARKRSERNVQDLAYHCAVSERTYRYWESGEVLPTWPQIRMLMQVFDDAEFTRAVVLDVMNVSPSDLGLNRWSLQMAI